MERKENSEELSIKIVLVGEAGVGKTSIIGSYFDKPLKTYITTNSPIENFRDIELNGKKISLSIWDTAGQEVFRSLNKLFYQDANIIIIVYSIDDEHSFEEIKNYWMDDVKEKGSENKVIAIFGHKSDLYLNEEVNEEEAREYAEKNAAKFFLTNSTQDGIKGIQDNIDTLIKMYFKNFDPQLNLGQINRISLMDGLPNPQKNKNSKCKCNK
jgi:small GTP-binding protein